MLKRVACQYDCPDTCGLVVDVIDGKVASVCADKEHPRTRGMVCRKVQHYEEMINSKDRILYPMKRVGKKGEGLFERISWDEAVEVISSRWKDIIASYGAESILPYSYAGTEGILQKNCGIAFFNYMGASKLLRTICSSAKGAGYSAVMGSSIAMSTHMLESSDRILVWGANLAATRIHDVTYIQKARKKGAKVTLIEVYTSPAASYCDDVILLKPGSDSALALAMIHVLEREGLTDREYIASHVEGYDKLLKELPAYTPEWASMVCGISASVIEDLAISYGKADRPAILIGSGLSRHLGGAMMNRCITALPAVVGSLKKGYGVCGMAQSAKWGNLSLITRPDFDCHGARTINMMKLASALDESLTNPPVKSLYVYHSNPLAVTANQAKVRKGLEREDLFTVVHERFMTDTAKYADIILPALFTIEAYDIFQPYGYNGIQYSKKAVDAPGECKSNWDTFCLLAKAMGFTDSYFSHTEEEMCNLYLDHKTGQQGELSEEEWNRLMDGYAVEKVLSGEIKIKTPTGKVMLDNPAVSPSLICHIPVRKDKDLLHLVAAPSVYTLNSTFTTEKRLVDKRGKMTILMSASDAERAGIETGDRVLCENDLASVAFYAEVTEDVPAGTVIAEGVYTVNQSIDGNTVNALLGESLSDLGEATTMNANYVSIRKVNHEDR